MSETVSLPFLPAPRLADLAFAPLPAWVWAGDASRIVWANAVGAAMFGAPSLAAAAEKRFDAKHPAAQQVARLAGSLPDGATRLERLRGFASGVGRLLTCNCSRLALADGSTGILIIAAEPAGPNLALNERVRRLLTGFDGPFAAFGPDGALLHAGPLANERLFDAATLAGAGASHLAAQALAQGEASGETPSAQVTLQRMGSANATILLATFAPPPAPIVEPEPAAVIEPVVEPEPPLSSIPTPAGTPPEDSAAEGVAAEGMAEPIVDEPVEPAAAIEPVAPIEPEQPPEPVVAKVTALQPEEPAPP
jgi:hypothetical protein